MNNHLCLKMNKLRIMKRLRKRKNRQNYKIVLMKLKIPMINKRMSKKLLMEIKIKIPSKTKNNEFSFNELLILITFTLLKGFIK